MENPLKNPAITESEAGSNYKKFRKQVMDKLHGMDQKSQKAALAWNRDFVRGLNDPVYRESYKRDLVKAMPDFSKALTPASVHVDRVLTIISIKYKNDAYIGDQLMPVVPVGKRSDVYWTYPKREILAFPDDEITHRGKANELEQTRSTDNYSVRDYAFAEFLDLESVENEDQPLNEMVDIAEHVADGLEFKREKRIMALVGVAGTYAGNTAGATTQWDDATGGTIVNDINGATSNLWMGRGVTRTIGFCPITVWNQGIANNDDLLDKFKHTTPGFITRSIASHFQLDDILIIRAREDTANSGQTASYARMVTADIFGIVRVAQNPTRKSAHFGSTFRTRWTPYSTQWLDPAVGVKGGIWHRMAVSEDHKVVAPDTGYLITACLS